MNNKYSVLVADDEKIIRDGIKHLINTHNSCPYKVTAEASNGQEALDICLNSPIDIVLTDIKMPVMDGLEFFRALKGQRPHIKVIILSNHADFHYAKEALSLGVVDYMLKVVIDYQELFNVLEKARKIIEEYQMENGKIEIIKNKVATYAEEFKSKFLIDLVTGSVKKEEIGSKIRFWELNIKEKNLVCAVIEPYNKYLLQSKYQGNSLRLLEEKVTNAIHSILGKYDMGETCRIDCLDFVILLSFEKEHSRQSIEMKIHTIFSEVRDTLRSILSTEIAIGLSDIGIGFHIIHKIYLEALKAVEFKFYQGPNKNIQFDRKSCFVEIDYKWSVEMRNDIIEAVKKCDLDRCIGLIEDLYKKIEKIWAFPQSVKRFSIDLIVGCLKVVENSCITIDSTSEEYFERYNEILSMDNIFSISSFVNDFIIKIIDGMQTFYSKKYRKEVWDAIRLINVRYNEELSMPAIAFHVGMSTNYFCEIFKQETGENVVTYINKIRIEKAKELLMDGKMKIYEVAEKVGIMDSRYFNKVFKKITGVNASDIKSKGIR